MVAYSRMLPIADETVIYDCPRRNWDSIPSGPVGVGPKPEPKIEQEDAEQRDEEATSSTVGGDEASMGAPSPTPDNQQTDLAPVPSKDDELTIVYEKVRGDNGAQASRGQGNFEVGGAKWMQGTMGLSDFILLQVQFTFAATSHQAAQQIITQYTGTALANSHTIVAVTCKHPSTGESSVAPKPTQESKADLMEVVEEPEGRSAEDATSSTATTTGAGAHQQSGSGTRTPNSQVYLPTSFNPYSSDAGCSAFRPTTPRLLLARPPISQITKTRTNRVDMSQISVTRCWSRLISTSSSSTVAVRATEGGE